jgi:hypothetical protein
MRLKRSKMPHFKHQQVRDLYWALKSPLLTANGALFEPFLPEPEEAWFEALDADPSALEAYLEATHHVPLGRYFESLMGFWLENSDAITLIDRNVQAQDEKVTVGEFDVLCKLPENPIPTHLELAVKFYMLHGEGDDAAHWYGPRVRDRFDLKLNKLLQKQAKLSESHAGKQVLSERGIDSVAVKILSRGRLFFPWERFFSGALTLPDVVSKEALKGWWLHKGMYAALKTLGDVRFELLEDKKTWLAPREHEREAGLLDYEALVAYIRDKNEPLRISVLRWSDGAMLFLEESTGFILEDGWPEVHSATALL